MPIQDVRSPLRYNYYFHSSLNRGGFRPRVLSRGCLSAMRGELNATPKPGLVDRADAGAHEDMDWNTFQRSINTLGSYYYRVAEASRGFPASPVLLEKLRPLGKQAEVAMFAATGGVNTHRGQIFLLGLLTAAMSAEKGAATTESLVMNVRLLCEKLVQNELVSGLKTPQTHGEKVFSAFGAVGIRGEAQDGFPSLFEKALPVVQQMEKEGFLPNDASIQALLHLMATVEDTNVLRRTGEAGLRFMKQKSLDCLSLGGVTSAKGRQNLIQMNSQFIEKRISPGGCADLLAGALFVNKFFPPEGFSDDP